MTDLDFTPERARVVHCMNCGMHDKAVQLRPGYAQFCGTCGRPMMVCNADSKGCGSGQAGGTVSLPTQAEAEPAPVEETQPLLSDWCDLCGFARAYCRGHS